MIITTPLTLEQRIFLQAQLLALEQLQAARLHGDMKNDTAATLSVTDQLQCDALDRALVRIHGKSYGMCVDCNEPIAFARLKMEPQTLRCHACQTTYEFQTWCAPLERTTDEFLQKN